MIIMYHLLVSADQDPGPFPRMLKRPSPCYELPMRSTEDCFVDSNPSIALTARLEHTFYALNTRRHFLAGYWGASSMRSHGCSSMSLVCARNSPRWASAAACV